jgi:hypothetical protein
MTKPPENHIAPSAAAAKHGGHRLLSPARYRHPGDMIRLIIAGLVLAAALAITAVTHATNVDASAVAVSAVAPSTLAGWVLGGVVQALFAAAAVAAFLVTLRYHRYRLLGGLHFKAFIPLDAGGPLTLQAPRAGDIAVALRRPRSAAEAWLRAQGLMQTGGVVH